MCAAILAALMVAGCGEDTVKPISRNLPPETIASLPDDLDPDHQVPYTQTLSWWGEDVDGEVTHYLFRFLYDVDEWCAPDSAWHRTTATESTFYLPVTDGQAAHSFEVKAVDDDGAEDPTPARVNLYVRNSPPEVFFGEPRLLPDTTLTAVSFSWTGRDTVDGSETIREYLIWLDGEETPRVVDRLVTSYTFLREDLEDPSIPAGGGTTRTVYIQAVDSGCDTSETLSHAWYVRQPNGRILLVDDVPNRLLGAILSDQFYRQTLNTLADEGEPYTLLEFETHGEFVRVEDVYPNLEPFDVVLWYTGRDSMGSDNLRFAETGLREYLDTGGSLFLVTWNALGTRGIFTAEFGLDYLGVEALYLNIAADIPGSNFDIRTTQLIQPGQGTELETLKGSVTQIWVEHMNPVEGVDILYHPPGYAGIERAVVMRHPLPAGGSVVYASSAFEFCNGLGNAQAQVQRIVGDLLP